MKKNKKLIMGIVLIVLAILLCGFTLHYKNNNNNKDYKYKIHYFDGFIPGTNYYIYIYDNNSIKVVSQAGCSLEECHNGTKTMPKYTKIIKFNEENTKFVINYLKKEFNLKSNKEKYISSDELNNDDLILFNSLIDNNEKYLEKVK